MPRADYGFDQGASTKAASTRCAFVANCETDVISGRETCVRVGVCTGASAGVVTPFVRKGQSPSPRLLPPTLLLLPQRDSDGARPPSDRQLTRALIVHLCAGRNASGKWRFRGSSPSEHLVGTALGRPHS